MKLLDLNNFIFYEWMFSLSVFCTDRYRKCRHVSAKSWKARTCYNFLVSYRSLHSLFKKFWVSSLKKVFINIHVLKLCYILLAKIVTVYFLWLLFFFFFPCNTVIANYFFSYLLIYFVLCRLVQTFKPFRW